MIITGKMGNGFDALFAYGPPAPPQCVSGPGRANARMKGLFLFPKPTMTCPKAIPLPVNR